MHEYFDSVYHQKINRKIHILGNLPLSNINMLTFEAPNIYKNVFTVSRRSIT